MNNEINDGGPAFPKPVSIGAGGEIAQSEGGMTLRDYFASQAISGTIISTINEMNQGRTLKRTFNDQVSMDCYSLADAMIKARSA